MQRPLLGSALTQRVSTVIFGSFLGIDQYLPVFPISIASLSTKLTLNLLVHSILALGRCDTPRCLVLANKLQSNTASSALFSSSLIPPHLCFFLSLSHLPSRQSPTSHQQDPARIGNDLHRGGSRGSLGNCRSSQCWVGCCRLRLSDRISSSWRHSRWRWCPRQRGGGRGNAFLVCGVVGKEIISLEKTNWFWRLKSVFCASDDFERKW